MIIKNQISGNKFWASVFLAQILLFWGLSKSDEAITFASIFFEAKKHLHQYIFSWFSFSFGDVFYISFILFLLYLFSKIFFKNHRKKAIRQLLISLNIFYFLYQIFWGFLYFQKPIINELPQESPNMEEAKTLAIKYLKLCKETRTRVDENQNGVFYIADLEPIKTEILAQQNRLPLRINSKKPTDINAFKSSIFRTAISYSGILGYYNPFTAEAQYNAHLPATYLPFTLAHESAHQLGYAREQEANFIGYLIGKNTQSDALKYSTQYFVLKNLLNTIAQQDEDFVKEMIKNYSPEMQRDRLAERAFVEKHSGWLDAFFGFTNDWFLKSNQQDGSVTYSYFTDLLIRYEREVRD